jgi:hypothetical protein
LAHFDQLQLAPKLGRYRLKSNPLILTGHQGGEAFGAFDLAAEVVGVGHDCRPLVRSLSERSLTTLWLMICQYSSVAALVKTEQERFHLSRFGQCVGPHIPARKPQT